MIVARESSVIEETIEECLLTDYWHQKDKLDAKYKKQLDSLEVEEAEEIKYRTKGLTMQREAISAERVLEVIAAVHDEYCVTRGLLLKQKILEVEEMIEKFQTKLA